MTMMMMMTNMTTIISSHLTTLSGETKKRGQNSKSVVLPHLDYKEDQFFCHREHPTLWFGRRNDSLSLPVVKK